MMAAAVMAVELHVVAKFGEASHALGGLADGLCSGGNHTSASALPPLLGGRLILIHCQACMTCHA